MAYGINLTDEELAFLAGLLRREMGDIRSEHRRTRNPDFRSQIEHTMKLQRRIFKTIEEARERESRILARPSPG